MTVLTKLMMICRYARYGPERAAGVPASGPGAHRVHMRHITARLAQQLANQAQVQQQLANQAQGQQQLADRAQIQQALQQASQQGLLLPKGPDPGMQQAQVQALLQQAAGGVPQQPYQQPSQQPPQQHALLRQAAGRHALSASQHASATLPPSSWSDPFASASAAAVAAAASSADHAAAYLKSLVGSGAAGASANPAGSSANPGVAVSIGGHNRYALRSPGRAEDKPGARPSSASSTQGQATGSMDPDAARASAASEYRNDASSAALANRPFTRTARSNVFWAATADTDGGSSNDAHAQVVRQLLASRNRSKADRASDAVAAGGQTAQPEPREADLHVNTAASLTAVGKSDETGSLLPAGCVPHSPSPSLRPRDRYFEGHQQQGRRLRAITQMADRLSSKPDRADTNTTAEAALVAAVSKLASITPAVNQTVHHKSNELALQSVSNTQTGPGAPNIQGGAQDNPWGYQGVAQDHPSGCHTEYQPSGCQRGRRVTPWRSQEGTEDNPPGSQGGSQDNPPRSQGGPQGNPPGSQGGAEDPSSFAAAMPPPAPRQPAMAPADAADLLWSPSSHSRDMHSLGAGLMNFSDPTDERPSKLSGQNPTGSKMSQPAGQDVAQAVASDIPDGTDWGMSSSVDRVSSLTGKVC